MTIAGDIGLVHKGVLALAAVLLIAAALQDARSYRISNYYSLGLTVLFPVFVVIAPEPVAWIQNLLVAVLVLAAGFLLYAKKYLGAGDVKLLGAASLWAGPSHVGLLLFITAVAGGLLAAATAGVAYWRQSNKEGSLATLARMRIPYGVAIALGGLCSLSMLFHPANLS